MGYITRYDTHYNDETGEWLEKIGFCSDGDDCSFCDAYKEDGSPENAFVALETIKQTKLDKFPW
jgi:hypothetical protein